MKIIVNGELMHWGTKGSHKYIEKIKNKGKWIYTYAKDKANSAKKLAKASINAGANKRNAKKARKEAEEHKANAERFAKKAANEKKAFTYDKMVDKRNSVISSNAAMSRLKKAAEYQREYEKSLQYKTKKLFTGALYKLYYKGRNFVQRFSIDRKYTPETPKFVKNYEEYLKTKNKPEVATNKATTGTAATKPAEKPKLPTGRDRKVTTPGSKADMIFKREREKKPYEMIFKRLKTPVLPIGRDRTVKDTGSTVKPVSRRKTPIGRDRTVR